MTAEETLRVLRTRASLWPSAAREDIETIARAWHACFRREPFERVSKALLACYNKRDNGFPPIPGEVRAYMEDDSLPQYTPPRIEGGAVAADQMPDEARKLIDQFLKGVEDARTSKENP